MWEKGLGFPLSIYLLHLGVPNLQDLMPDAIIIDIKCIINVMHLNHPKPSSPTHSWNQSPVQKRLGTTARSLQEECWGLGEKGFNFPTLLNVW